ncbi:hypothetical protein [Streptomyces sp. NPDC058401]|uniref:hypothetical protein n=1 Tax=Streptomyces sp. NPDC058401 TaxID=3346480 RepID=UPI003664C023
MERKTGSWWAAAALGVLTTASLSGTAGAQTPTLVDPPSASASPSASPSGSSRSDEWYGANHPGQTDPSDPNGNDWHCDRSGSWHNDEMDRTGHPDSRCTPW